MGVCRSDSRLRRIVDGVGAISRLNGKLGSTLRSMLHSSNWSSWMILALGYPMDLEGPSAKYQAATVLVVLVIFKLSRHPKQADSGLGLATV